jgi:hypothetical protein
MKPDQDPILQAVLSGTETDALRQVSLARGLALLRPRRQRRRIVRLGLVAALPLVILLGLVLLVVSPPHGGPPESSPQDSALAARSNGIEYINDEQLFALFPDRALALVGKPGQQQLLFLGQARKPLSQ